MLQSKEPADRILSLSPVQPLAARIMFSLVHEPELQDRQSKFCSRSFYWNVDFIFKCSQNFLWNNIDLLFLLLLADPIKRK